MSDDARRLERAAEAFHAENPHVMAQLVAIAKDARSKGVQRLGIKLLFERLRWLAAMRTEGDKYKVNNTHAPWYARQIMQIDGLADLFETRNSPHDPEYHARGPQPGQPGYLASLPVVASITGRPIAPPVDQPATDGRLF